MEKIVISPETLLAAGFVEQPGDPLVPYAYYLCRDEDMSDSEFVKPCMGFGSPRSVWEFFLVDIMGVFIYVNLEDPQEAVDWANKIGSFEPPY